MAITLKSQTINKHRSIMIDRGAGHGNQLLQIIQRHLEESEIPGRCEWRLEEVQAGGFFKKIKRTFLHITWDEFKEYQFFIGTRDFGIHLDVVSFAAVKYGFFKKLFLMMLFWRSLFRLKGIFQTQPTSSNLFKQLHQNAYVSVVERCIKKGLQELLEELGQDPSLADRKEKGVVGTW